MGATKRADNNGGALNLSIIQGTFMEKSNKDNPEAVKREYEDKNGDTKFKYEVHYKNVDGLIYSVEFKDGDFGEQCIITLVDAGENIKIYMPTDSRYFTDFAKKLPNIDLGSYVEFMPYDFEGDNGKQVKGLSIKQNGEKIYSHYYDADKKKTINGLPQPDKDWKTEWDKDDWKMFFIKERKFLKKKVQAVEFSEVVPSTEPKKAPKANTKATQSVADDSDDDLPF